MRKFTPHPLLHNAHLMTLAAGFWLRRFPRLQASASRLFETEPGTRIRADCHWQQEPERRPTLILLHGLEGSSESGYMLGAAEKAFVAGCNVLRLNQRNCGGTEALTPTLYNSGLSCDVQAVVKELIEQDCLPEIFVAGFSMGGNLVLKMAGEFGQSPPVELCGVVGICPSCDLAACADAIGERRNGLYERHFVKRLKQRMRRKALLFPERYPLNGLKRVRSVREFDDVITARFCGFRDADDYYARSSSLPLLANIRITALLLVAQDDPMIPFRSFDAKVLAGNSNLELVAPQHGGHCAFIARESGDERFWAEARIVEFCLAQSRLARSSFSVDQ